ncbi:MAG: hypothetical protein MK078_13745 [Crocinitomicaceae bacterium]|nr:hypothetical protein [Crocinitomicaceae bacterium]
MRNFILIVFFISACSLAQENNFNTKGDLEFGLRTSSSLFGRDGIAGLGTGGQFRVQILDKINTEWFADYISLDLNGAGVRNNAHIGWSVLFYPKKFGSLIPYVAAGHCFDYAKVIPNSTSFVDRSDDIITRWSSAVQAGIGSHYYFTPRFNLSFSAQYMMHLGQHLDYDLDELSQGYYLETHDHSGSGEAALEGHLLLTFSLNYKLADLW